MGQKVADSMYMEDETTSRRFHTRVFIFTPRRRTKTESWLVFGRSYYGLSNDTGELGVATQRSRLFQRDIHATHRAAQGSAVLLLLSRLRKETKNRLGGPGLRFDIAITNSIVRRHGGPDACADGPHHTRERRIPTASPSFKTDPQKI